MSATHPFDVVVTDSLGATATQPFTLNLAPANTTPDFTVHVASGYPLDHTVALSGTSPISCAATGMPAGMSFSNATKKFTAAAGGVVSGNYSVTLTCTNCSSGNDTAIYLIRIL